MQNESHRPAKTLKDRLALSPLEKYVIFGINYNLAMLSSEQLRFRLFSLEANDAYCLTGLYDMASLSIGQYCQH